MHPSHGGCTVQGLCTREFRGEVRQYYVLLPTSEPNTTILDPVENIAKIGLCRMITPQQADDILAHASAAKPNWIRDNARRKNEYIAIIKEGSLLQLAGVIKDLMIQATNVSLNQSDRILLRNAQKKLLSVIALAKEIDLEQAVDLMSQAVQRTAS